MRIVQCMGGWCRQRDKCAHYSAPPTLSRAPAERLCPRDEETPELAKATPQPLEQAA